MQVHPPLMDVPHTCIADGVTQPQTVTADQDQTELYYNRFGAIVFFS